jgi:hypothetical protein
MICSICRDATKKAWVTIITSADGVQEAVLLCDPCDREFRARCAELLKEMREEGASRRVLVRADIDR